MPCWPISLIGRWQVGKDESHAGTKVLEISSFEES